METIIQVNFTSDSLNLNFAELSQIAAAEGVIIKQKKLTGMPPCGAYEILNRIFVGSLPAIVKIIEALIKAGTEVYTDSTKTTKVATETEIKQAIELNANFRFFNAKYSQEKKSKIYKREAPKS